MRPITRASFLPFLLLAGVTLPGAHALAADAPELVTTVTVTADAVTFRTRGKHAGVRMVVAGPEDWHRDTVFGSEVTPVLAATDEEGNRLPDGLYSVELLARPRLPARVRQQAQTAHERGDKRAVRRALRHAGLALEPRYHHQSFTIAGGKFLDPGRPEPEPEGKPEEPPAASACRDCGLPAPVATLARLGPPARWTFDAALRGDVLLVDQVFNQNVEIMGSLCVGLDCVNGENFGFDTIRLKENNLRINFDDSSSSAGFPKNDWTLQGNDSVNGGASYYAVVDATAGRQVFRVNAGAPVNALFVDAQGDVGLGTANPTVEFHMADGDTPTIRLEQTHVSGFTPQTWDVGSNETNFFVRDVTNGSKLPLKIRPGAPDNALYINTNGNIGLGINNPSAPLHLANAAPQVLLQNTSTQQQWGVMTNATGFRVQDNAGAAPLQIEPGVPDGAFQIQSGQVYVNTSMGVNQNLVVYDGNLTVNDGDVTISGSGKGLYLGGTGAANKVDYYQAGTWAPAFTGSGGGTATYSANGQKGFYQRVGNWVTLQGRIKLTSLSGFSGTAQITNLPFAPASGIGVVFSGSVGNLSGLSAALTGSPILYADRTGVIKLQQSDGATQTDVSPGATLTLAFSVSYQI